MSFSLAYIEKADTPQHATLVAKQCDSVLLRRTVTCECNTILPVEAAFRCLYCGIWFCRRCAERHFGKTVAEWDQEKKREKLGITKQDIAETMPPKHPES